MPNSDIEAAWAYHNATKHSYESVRTSRHTMDWEIQPLPFKIYTTLEPIPLPREAPFRRSRRWRLSPTRRRRPQGRRSLIS